MQRALEAATVTLRELADRTGIPYATLQSWKLGRRNPDPQQLAVVAEALDRQARDLRAAAKALRGAEGE